MPGAVRACANCSAAVAASTVSSPGSLTRASAKGAHANAPSSNAASATLILLIVIYAFLQNSYGGIVADRQERKTCFSFAYAQVIMRAGVVRSTAYRIGAS